MNWKLRYLWRGQLSLFNHYFFYHLRRNQWTDEELQHTRGIDRLFMNLKRIYLQLSKDVVE